LKSAASPQSTGPASVPSGNCARVTLGNRTLVLYIGRVLQCVVDMEDGMGQAAIRASARPRPLDRAIGAGQRPLAVRTPLAVIDWRSRRVKCSNSSCSRVITRLVRIGRGPVLRPMFSGEWHEGEDRVWRLTSYARATRGSEAGAEGAVHSTGRSLGLRRRRLWSDPTTWQPVVASTPCAAECSHCRTVQTINLG
jgi:hypothetical protein